MRWAGFLAVVLLIAGALSACRTPGGPRDRGDGNAPASADAAAQFGKITLPPGIEVLGADTQSGRDIRYRLALRVNDAQLRELVDQFHVKPRKSELPASRPVIAGPALDSAPRPLYAEDRVATAEHGPVSREIIVDERTPDEVYVHLSFFTT